MADPGILSITVIDDGQVSATYDNFISYDGALLTLDAATLNAQNTALLVDKITDAKVTGIRLVINVPLPVGLKANPVADSSVEKTGLFNFSLLGSAKYTDSIDVPAIANALVTNKKINLSNADYINWRDRVLDDTDGLHVVSKFAFDLLGLIDAAVTFRKHRRATRAASREVAP